MALVCQSWFRSCETPFQMASRLRNSHSALSACLQTTITSSFHLQITYRLKRWTPDFPSFETRYHMHNLSSGSASKMCPTVAKLRCDISVHGLHNHLQTAITFPFQIEIEYCLKLWTPDFQSFQTRYCIHNLNFGK